MFNQDYNEYLRSVLGDGLYQNEYDQYPMQYDGGFWDRNDENRRRELEECYPDIYKLLYPIVQKECRNNTRSLTKDVIEELTDRIYNQVIQNNEIQLNINIQNQSNNRAQENNKETRQFNRGLSDLIKILIIRELLGFRPGRPGPRPRSPRPMMPPPRPPFYRDNDVYEY